MSSQAQNARLQFEGTARTFWFPGALALALVILALSLDWLAVVPFVSKLVGRPGAVGLIAGAVLTVTLWIILSVVVRFQRSRRELDVVRNVRQFAKRTSRFPVSSVDPVLVGTIEGGHYQTSVIRRRFQLLRHGQERADMEAALAGQAGLDSAHSEVSYGPVRALVWSLPALGFLGTATEMSYAVRGLGAAVAGTASYNDLRNFLVQRVLPPLADAFDITLFALGSSVLCYVLLSLVYAHQQRCLLEADAVSLELLAALDPPHAPPGQLRLNGDVDALARQVAESNKVVTASNQLLTTISAGGGVGQITQILIGIDQRLEQISRELGKDLVIQRHAPASRRGPSRS